MGSGCDPEVLGVLEAKTSQTRPYLISKYLFLRGFWPLQPPKLHGLTQNPWYQVLWVPPDPPSPMVTLGAFSDWKYQEFCQFFCHIWLKVPSYWSFSTFINQVLYILLWYVTTKQYVFHFLTAGINSRGGSRKGFLLRSSPPPPPPPPPPPLPPPPPPPTSDSPGRLKFFF